MAKKTKKTSKNLFIIILISIGLIGIYILILFFLQSSSGIEKCNEFGDYVGGVLNPLFALLSTVAIIYLTYILAMNEDIKAEKSIETQKRITLNQMRQDALNRLAEKLNLFVYDLDKMTIINSGTMEIVKAVLSNNNKKKDNKKIMVWFVISTELENFLQLEYLFKDLFKRDEFSKTFDSLREITLKLLEEEGSKLLIEQSTLEKYIELKQQTITELGNYIYSEF